MKYFLSFKKFILLFLLSLSCFWSYPANPKKILILVNGQYNLADPATGEGRMLANLLGHFNTSFYIKGTQKYIAGEIAEYDAVFYLGHDARYPLEPTVANDLLNMPKKVIWINGGLKAYSQQPAISSKLGFLVTDYEDSSDYNQVHTPRPLTFSKGTPSIYHIKILNPSKVNILATAFSSKTKKEIPYFVRSGNFWYVADMPLKRTLPDDRYLLFADMLHDILEEPHEHSPHAIIRIEDVSPNTNPEYIRDVATCLYERNVPFLIGVIPFYVNPAEDVRFSLSDKPELVDALKYAVEKGATLVMHGSTHQYKGQTAEDFEFWDVSTDKPIGGETENIIASKIETGLNEFIKNGLYPLTWETPHYTAPIKAYKIFSKYFSTAVEQPMVIDNRDFGQYFPYLIYKDIYNRMVFPENMGFIALSPDRAREEQALAQICRNARTLVGGVRDGIVSFYYHAFLGPDLLGKLVDSIQAMGVTFLDLKNYTHKVQLPDKVILCGSQPYSITIDNAFLEEDYFDAEGKIIKSSYSEKRINGTFSKHIELLPGQWYVAKPLEYKVKEVAWHVKLRNQLNHLRKQLFSKEEPWEEARAAIVWLSSARGAAMNNQQSFISVFRSVNIRMDTLPAEEKMPDLSSYNVVIVPYASADALSQAAIQSLVSYIHSGGNIITDRHNKLTDALGFTYTKSPVVVRQINDLMYITENIAWQYPELSYKFDYTNEDEIFCEEPLHKTAVVIGRQIKRGKVIYLNVAFDPYSQMGYSRFPFLLHHVNSYFRVRPVVKRESLEFYFDPGYRQNISIETLVREWVKHGIRIIHVAGWHEYTKYTYDYGRLLKEAHANGILVYAWLEPPQVSQKFWLDHPEWREKNYLGKDVRPSWRYPVALTDEKCLQAVINKYLDFLKKYDWDGVNLAECYFETAKGIQHPEYFTPMHPSAIREVYKRYGFYMSDLFKPYSGYYWQDCYEYLEDMYAYRREKVKYVHQRFLDAFYSMAATNKKGFEVIVTTMDSYGSPELKKELGLYTEDIIELQKKYGFHLQIEDPQRRWSESPLRYKEIGDFYSTKIEKEKMLIDLNILSFRSPDNPLPFPTLIQTGTECFHLINISASSAPRFVIYSEASVNSQDMPWLAYAAASDVDFYYENGKYHVSSTRSFILSLPPAIRLINLDDQYITGFRDNLYLIPAGTHTIDINEQNPSVFSTLILHPRILSFTGNVLQVSYDMQKISMRYQSSTRALVSVSHNVSSILVDGENYPFTQMKGNDCISVFLPEGTHEVIINTGNKISAGIYLTSLWSTTAIVIIGTLAICLLFILYIFLKVTRKETE